MTLDDFIETADGAPWELEKFASVATEVDDENGDELRMSAARFLSAKQDFEDALQEAGVEIG